MNIKPAPPHPHPSSTSHSNTTTNNNININQTPTSNNQNKTKAHNNNNNNNNNSAPHDMNKIIHLYMPNATHPRFPNNTIVSKKLSAHTLNIEFMRGVSNNSNSNNNGRGSPVSLSTIFTDPNNKNKY